MNRSFKYFFCIFILLAAGCKQQVVNTPPYTYVMEQNFPNPFTDSTVVLYGVPLLQSGSDAPWIQIVATDRFNQVEAYLVNNHLHPAGSNFRAVWYGKGLDFQIAPKGIYYIEMRLVISTLTDNEYQVVARKVAVKE